MEIRFIILLPSQIEEVYYALATVVSRIKASYDEVWITAVIQENLVGIAGDDQNIDQLISFRRTPGEKIAVIKELYADYLIDISGESRFWLFRNRLRIVDFKFSVKQIKTYRDIADFKAGLSAFSIVVEDLLSVFDLVDWPLAEIDIDYWESALKKHIKE